MEQEEVILLLVQTWFDVAGCLERVEFLAKASFIAS